jgi:hypothetical protein
MSWKRSPCFAPFCTVLFTVALWHVCATNGSGKHQGSPTVTGPPYSLPCADVVRVLPEAWRLSNANRSINVPATVPGGVQDALLNGGLIGDPVYRLAL